MTSRVTVIDYGIGNLHSVKKAFEHEGAEVGMTSDPKTIESADRIVLPGVGAFGDGMKGLVERSLVEPLRSFRDRDRPVLGICLGMQLLFSGSEEFGEHAGLDLIPGRVVEIPSKPGFKVPQIGWNRIHPPDGRDWQGSILEESRPGEMVYFVHSFTANPDDTFRLADSDYGGCRVSAAVQRGNVLGTQFHPEKSGPAGLAMIRRFLQA